tara:strand:- start:463 stop:1050 length:588 start_codon:yes stop_codon:yes gene_type:complete
MAIITTGQTFTATDTVTNTKLQDIADAATFNEPVDETSLELKDDGKLGIKDGGITLAKFGLDLLESIYPVGFIWMNANNVTNPGTLLGFGTWEEFGAGRVLLGAGEGTDNQPAPEVKTFIAGDTGGEYSHTLTEDEMPSHNHNINNMGLEYNYDRDQTSSAWDNGGNKLTDLTGGDLPHNNIQPYIAVHMWTRTI